MSAAQYDIKVEQGATFHLRIRLSSTTLSFTGSVTTGQMRAMYSSPTPLATFTCTLGNDSTGDYVDVILTDTETSAITVPAARDYIIRSVNYCYDIEMQILGGEKLRLLQGTVEFVPEVTRVVAP